MPGFFVIVITVAVALTTAAATTLVVANRLEPGSRASRQGTGWRLCLVEVLFVASAGTALACAGAVPAPDLIVAFWAGLSVRIAENRFRRRGSSSPGPPEAEPTD